MSTSAERMRRYRERQKVATQQDSGGNWRKAKLSRLAYRLKEKLARAQAEAAGRKL